MNQPVAVNNFKLYAGTTAKELIGVGQVELPEIQMLTTELNAAGMGGKMNVALTGQTDSMTATINLPVATMEALSLITPDVIQLTARAAVETLNRRTHKKEIKNLTVIMRGAEMSEKLGSIQKGEAMDASFSFELDYLKIIYDGQVYREIDKFNNIFRVKDKDYSADVRNAI